jgi:hypothetical protein
MLGKFKIDFLQSAPVSIPLSTSSATAVIPSGSRLIGLTTTANCRFRITPLAQAVAVATDPLLTPNSEIQIFRIDESMDTNVSAILDLSITAPQVPTLSIFRVFEA